MPNTTPSKATTALRNKTVAAWLAFVTGQLGLHRFYTNAEVLAPDFVVQVVAAIAAARPLVDFLNEALPDLE